MKKLFILIIAIAVLFALPACGSEKSEEDAPAQSQAESSEESVSTEETSDEVTEEEASASDAAGEDVTVEYEGISFVVPAGVEYEETDNECLDIYFEPQQRVCFIQPTGFSKIMETEMDSLALSSILSGFDDVQNEQKSNVKIAGVTGVCEVASVKISGSWVSMTAVAFTNPDTFDQYVIYYAVTTSAEGDNSDFFDFIESVSFVE